MYPIQASDVKITYADTAKLEQLTGYKLSTVLIIGNYKFVEWYKIYLLKYKLK